MKISFSFAGVQQLGRALMLPIAVLPVAGLLLRLGQPDLFSFPIMAQAGDAIFSNLALIFAIGVAVGFARDNNGASGLAGAIGYLVLVAVLKAINPKIDMGVLAGIISGLIAGALYNRYRDIKLVPWLAFFGGRRFIPIATGFAMLIAGVLLGQVWLVVQQGIDALGHWIIGAGELGLFVYGVINRILIVTGLHHIINTYVWFQLGDFTNAAGQLVQGDLTRFFAGDPRAGMFMTGFFPVMMFGLPAACLAMYRTAKPENRTAVGGVLLSMALTAALTGVTEPVEFAFMFLAPFLYAIHAILMGISMALTYALGMRLGFGFSAGALDYALNFGIAQKPLLLFVVGAVYFIVYYAVFAFFIRRFNLMTPGREDTPPVATSGSVVASVQTGGRAGGYIHALGGAGNLREVDACTTRLRLQLVDKNRIDEAALKALGARGIVRPGGGSVQVVIGPEAELLADEIRAALAAPQTAAPTGEKREWLAALGGEQNLRNAEVVAGTRLRLDLADASRIDEAALKALGAVGIMKVSASLVHLTFSDKAESYLQRIRG